MSPADGSDFPHPPSAAQSLPDCQAILLHGGRALLLFEGAEAPPPLAGRLHQGGARSMWTAECWPVTLDGVERWHGLAVLDAAPAADAELVGVACGSRWRFAAAPRLDVAVEPLADLVRRAGANGRDVFDFLVKHLIAGRPADSTEARSHRAFARRFLTAAADRDGFIEVLAAPDTGGLFVQGWSMNLPAGPTILADAAEDAEDIELREVEVAHFGRDDILPPGSGICAFGKAWEPERLAALDALFFEQDGRLLRLDVVPGAGLLVAGERATTHVAHMLPRLAGPEGTLAAFKRVCRPRFGGVDTLSGATAPIAAALDCVLQAPDGALLVIGWMLDPLRKVERVLVKSSANLYARLDAAWCALPRPDLCRGFAQDPRFLSLLDERDAMHGFIVHAPARPAQVAGAQVYLELVLEDGSCLFRPLTVTPLESGERLPQILQSISPNEPELARIVEEHLAPFLAHVPPASRLPRRGGAVRPLPLGRQHGPRPVSAIVPFRALAELHPMLALLAGAPEAEMLDLTLVAARSVASDLVAPLGDAFRFYGLQGSLLIAADHDSLAARLDLGARASAAPRLLAWTPAALPKGPGWLARLLAEAAALPRPGLLSPALTYEDGSICFAGARQDPAGNVCALSGYGAERLHRGAPRPAPTGAAEIALVDRDALARAGGFTGHLFGDAFAHVDLADRLRRAGAGTWCSGAVEFWLLDDQPPGARDASDRVIRLLDAALIDRRGRLAAGDRDA